MKFKLNPLTGLLEINDAGTVESIESSKILPFVGTIDALATKDVELITYSSFFSVRYFIAMQTGSGKTTSFDYSITKFGTTDVKDITFGKIWGGLDHEVSSLVESGSVKLRIKNNETEVITYKIQKLGF